MTDNQKKIFSLAAAAVLTLIIVVIWYSLGDKEVTNQAAGTEENKLSSLSPMQVIKDEFSKAFSNFNNSAAVTNLESTSTQITDAPSVPIEILESTTTSTTTNI